MDSDRRCFRDGALGTKCAMPDTGDPRLPEDLPPEETTNYLLGLSRRLGEESRALMRQIDEALEERGRRVNGPERIDGASEVDAVVNLDAVVDPERVDDAVAPPPASSPFRRP